MPKVAPNKKKKEANLRKEKKDKRLKGPPKPTVCFVRQAQESNLKVIQSW